MSLHRRDMLKAVAVLSVATTLPRMAKAQVGLAPQPGPWRRFQITTTLQIAQPNGRAQAWIPLPAVNEKDWFQSIGSTWTTNGHASQVREPRYGAEMLHVEWAADEKAPVIEIVSKIASRDRAVDIATPGAAAP